MALVTPNTQAPAKAGWMKSGEASAAVAQSEKAEQQKRKDEQGKAFRFWLKDGESAKITFVDGDLTATPTGSFLLPNRFYEHNLFMNGNWGNHFVCPEKTTPGDKCPICESGDRPSLMAVFTVIDHRTFSSKDGTKTYKDTVKLFPATGQAFEQLAALALKVGGLAGSTWDVTRTGDKSPRTGNNFFPEGKTAIEELKAKYVFEKLDPKTNTKSTHTKFVPLNYETEIVYRTGDELRLMGLGKPQTAVQGFGPQGQQAQGGTAYIDHL